MLSIYTKKSARAMMLDDRLFAISKLAFADEKVLVSELTSYVEDIVHKHEDVAGKAKKYIQAYRKSDITERGLEAFFAEYSLDSHEGRAIMALAEALPRIPDADTANALMHDKLEHTHWMEHVGHSESPFVNASTRGLQVASELLEFGSLVSRIADPVVRETVKQMLKKVGAQYVMGADMAVAIDRAVTHEGQGYLMTYDMLGEEARTEVQAHHYFESYDHAIEMISHRIKEGQDLDDHPNMSIKISALFPRYELLKHDLVFDRLYPRLKALIMKARDFGVTVTLDAEESSRLDLMLELFAKLRLDKDLDDYEGLGIAVQAYQKRAWAVIDFLVHLAEQSHQQIPVRLVKGAYWDYEIKQAQLNGLETYPVFTNKLHTDIAYLACAKRLLKAREFVYPQFATHNAYTIAAIEHMAESDHFEFQRLHGMAEVLYKPLLGKHKCRIYAPVGVHKELLPYLIRRLLENGANSSFVRMLADSEIKAKDLLICPMAAAAANGFESPVGLQNPLDIYQDSQARQNSKGWDLGNKHHVAQIIARLTPYEHNMWHATSLVGGKAHGDGKRDVFKPHSTKHKIGTVQDAHQCDIKAALNTTSASFNEWNARSIQERATILERIAILYEEGQFELMSLIMQEAGKTLADSIAEVREAVDFCRYYASQARRLGQTFQEMPGVTGELNEFGFTGRGVFLCISPWNFPLAIFTGQVVAALVGGNTVIAKPAEQTSLIAFKAVQLMRDAGVPDAVLCLLLGAGEAVAAPLLQEPDIAGVAFTGSNETAKAINQQLAERKGAIIPFIAETGGLNAMIIDSSALLERAVDDVIQSAFGSAGQRCSALRVLFVQEDIKDSFYEMLEGAMHELEIGNPEKVTTDIGPVIDLEAKNNLEVHLAKMHDNHTLVGSVLREEGLEDKGFFVTPHIFEIPDISILQKENFGPILHIVPFKANKLDEVISQINSTGYGLTFGVHTRITGRAQMLAKRIKAGNVYINRNMIGAIVGSQPFGGQGKSGTGPKAGGPHYLPRFMTERTISTDLTAVGGDVDLLS